MPLGMAIYNSAGSVWFGFGSQSRKSKIDRIILARFDLHPNAVDAHI